MELFEKVYGCYYRAVTRILDEASKGPVTKQQMLTLCTKYGFKESALTIIPKLAGGDWGLLKPVGTSSYLSALSHTVKTPLTALQKAWLKSLLADDRIRLFFRDQELSLLDDALKDFPKLYSKSDFYYYDRYLDGDPYASTIYRESFLAILSAIRERKTLNLVYTGKHGNAAPYEVMPCQLQYSSKNDKFRLCCRCLGGRNPGRSMILNVERIRDCRLSDKCSSGPEYNTKYKAGHKSKKPVLIEISGERNSLERCMLHFASYEKHTVYDSERNIYLSSIYYDVEDETELLIDIFSFGPVIKVLGPDSFLRLLRHRIIRQSHILRDWE